MSNVLTGGSVSDKSLMQQLREDTNATYVDQLITDLSEYMEEIEVAQLNCEDANARQALDRLHQAASICGDGLRETWSKLHLRKHS